MSDDLGCQDVFGLELCMIIRSIHPYLVRPVTPVSSIFVADVDGAVRHEVDVPWLLGFALCGSFINEGDQEEEVEKDARTIMRI